MKLIKKIGLLLWLSGLIMYIPPVMNSLTLHFGPTIGHYSGVVSFAVGWSLLGAGLAFSAGWKYQRERIQKELDG